jgi:membrane associated rhomboid family serine protease
VECISGAQKAMPARRSFLGHRVPSNVWVTYTVIGLCVVSFILQWVTRGAWTSQWAFAPSIGAIQPWRFLTTAFLHSTSFVGHILFNMLAFYQCGQLLERTLGHARFATLCLLTALGGSVGFLLLADSPVVTNGSWFVPVVGASGMVFGLFGALIPILRRAGSNINSILGLIAINAVLGFVVPGIAWQAHLGGFVVGLAMAYAYAHIPRTHTRILAWVLPVVVFLALLFLAVLRYQTTGWLDFIRNL